MHNIHVRTHRKIVAMTKLPRNTSLLSLQLLAKTPPEGGRNEIGGALKIQSLKRSWLPGYYLLSSHILLKKSRQRIYILSFKNNDIFIVPILL